MLRPGAIIKERKGLFSREQMMEDHGAFGNAQRAGWCKSFGNLFSLILEETNTSTRRHNLLITGSVGYEGRQNKPLYHGGLFVIAGAGERWNHYHTKTKRYTTTRTTTVVTIHILTTN